MNNFLSKYKLLFLFLINTIPFALNVLFYSNGGVDDLYLFLPVFGSLTVLNYRFTDKVVHYIIIQFYHLVCLVSSGCISTHLYYNNISDDPMTPAIGMLLVYSSSIVVVITTVITGFVKRNSDRKGKHNEQAR